MAMSLCMVIIIIRLNEDLFGGLEVGENYIDLVSVHSHLLFKSENSLHVVSQVADDDVVGVEHLDQELKLLYVQVVHMVGLGLAFRYFNVVLS